MFGRIALVLGDGVIVLAAAFRGDDVRFLVDERRIPRRGHADRLREDGSDAVGHAMKTLVAMAVGVDAQPRDCRWVGLDL